ncbi:MAG: PAS domain S-box protein [Methanobacteriota archaeon]
MTHKTQENLSPTGGYILVVEDSTVQAEILVALLEENGFAVKKAANGKNALETVQQELPILVISDILMPEMNGFDLTREIRKNPALAPVPVLLLTSLTEAGDVAQALSCGADMFVTKPYDDPFLLKKIRVLLEEKDLPEKQKGVSPPFKFTYEGEEYEINTDREGILAFLLTTYEITMDRNQSLIRVQNELRELNDHLEQRVEERTKDLRQSHEDLQISYEKLTAAEEKLRQQYDLLAEQEFRIRENETLLNDVGKIVRVGGWELDIETKFVRWTRETYWIHEIPEDESYYLPQAILFYDLPDRKLFETAIQRCIEAQESYDLELRFTSAKGRHLWIRAKGHAVTVGDRVVRLMGTIQDITERKQVTEQLRESEQKYRTLIEALQEGIWAIDKDANTTFVNRRMAELLGYTIEEMHGRSLFSFMDEQGRMVAKQNIERRKSGIIEQYTFEFIKKDHSRIYTSLETAPLTDDTGTYIGAIAAVMDITERKRAQDEIIFKNIILSTQQETSLDSILIIDEHGKIISYNQRFIDLWDIPDNVIASRVDEQVLLSVKKKLENPGEFLARITYLYEHQNEKSREEIFFVDGRILDRFSAPMYGKDGRYFGRVWYFRDITKEKQAEREIKTLNQDLERRVEERTIELQQVNDQLLAINEELTASEEELHVQVDVTNEAYTALEKSEKQFRRLYESDLIGIAFANMEKLTDANDTFLSMIGYSREDLKQGLIKWEKRTPPEWALADLKEFEELQSHGSCTPFEKEYYRKDDSRVSVLVGAALLEENPLSWISFILDITDRKKMSQQISASLAEKETLLREIHHRVKNNLQIIISLLNLQIRRMDDPDTIETLKDCQNRVRSMALVHEHLYKGKDISRIDLGNYLKALGTGLFHSYEDGLRGIRFDIGIRDIYVDINIAIPVGLISNELIINSLKYAFSEKTGGILSLTATEDSETLIITVADNGGGIPEGITLENQDSMGLRLVNMFTDQLNATAVIDRTEGTKFTFTIPKPREQKPTEGQAP